MNNLPVFLLGSDDEIPAVLRCHAACVQVFSAFSHEELFHAQLGRLRVQTFNNRQLLVLDKRSAAVAVYSPFYRNLTAYLFHQEVIFPLFAAYQRGCRLELLVTAEALHIKQSNSERLLLHGKFCFQVTENRFQIEDEEIELATDDEAQQLFFLLFFLKTAYQGGIVDPALALELSGQSACVSPGRALSDISRSTLRQSEPVGGQAVSLFKQRVSSAVRPHAHVQTSAFVFQRFPHASQVDFTSSTTKRYTQARGQLNLAERLIESVSADYKRMAGSRRPRPSAGGDEVDEFADLPSAEQVQSEFGGAGKPVFQAHKHDGAAERALSRQQGAGEGEAATMPTEVLYDIRDAQAVLQREEIGQEAQQDKSATDELDVPEQGAHTEFLQVDREDEAAECVEVAEETFSVDSEDEHGDFLQAVERLSAGVSCLNAKKKPTHLAFRVGKQIIMQQKVFCGNQVVAGVVGIHPGERVKDLQAFDVQCKESSALRFYGSPEQVGRLRATVEAVLGGLRRGWSAE